MNAGAWALLVNAACTFYLNGLIWTVQRVHYPAFAEVSPEAFAEFEAKHRRDITPVVAPMMILELVSAIALLLARPNPMPMWAAALGLGLIAVIWISTFTQQVPLHARLSDGHDVEAIRALVRTNWIRTIAWTLRGGLVTYAIVRVISFENYPA